MLSSFRHQVRACCLTRSLEKNNAPGRSPPGPQRLTLSLRRRLLREEKQGEQCSADAVYPRLPACAKWESPSLRAPPRVNPSL